MDSLDRGSPVSTNPAYLIQGAVAGAGRWSRIARRTNSATEIPMARACFCAREYSVVSRLICVRITLSSLAPMITLLLPGLLEPVVGGFLGDDDVVHVALAQPG